MCRSFHGKVLKFANFCINLYYRIYIHIKDLASAPEIVSKIFYFFIFFKFFDFFLIFSIFFARTVYVTIQSDRVYRY